MVIILAIPLILVGVILLQLLGFLNILSWISTDIFAVETEIVAVKAASKFASDVRDAFRALRGL